MTLFTSLRHRPFALLWSGQAISRLGDSLYRIALAWWVLEKTGSATAMGTVLIFAFTPMVLFLLVGGVAVDRFPRIRIMLASDVARGMVAGGVALLAFGQRLELWHVYIASLLLGLVDAFFEPAYTAVIPELVPREALSSANSLAALSRQLIGVGGPAVGAALIQLGGTPVAFALDGLSFFVSGVCLLPLLNTALPLSPDRPAASMLQDVREGLGTVRASPWLWITISLEALTNITFFGPYSVALPFLVKDHLRAEVGALGLLFSMSSLGSVLGALWLGRWSRIRRRGWVAYGAWAMLGLMTLALGLPLPVVGAATVVLGSGLALAVVNLVLTNVMQEIVPRDLLGRVASIDYVGSWVFLPAGYALTGWATDLIGAPPVFIIGGALTIGLSALGLAHPAIRNLD
jgi:DHA3 family tetracycline resistance protein-like MFS transporter